MSRLQLPQVECVLPAAGLLGESPVWCPLDNVLYWVDIKRPAIHRFHPSTASCHTWPMEEEVTAIGLRQQGGAITSLRSSLAIIDFHTGEVCKLPGPSCTNPTCDLTMDGVIVADDSGLGRCMKPGTLKPPPSTVLIPTDGSRKWSPA